MHVSRILVPVDFSENSQAAVTYGSELSRRFDAEIHLLNVVEDIGAYAVEMDVAVSSGIYDVLEAEQRAKKMLDDISIQAGETCAVVRSTKIGPPWLGITEYAKEQSVDLIVIGTHGRTGLVHFVMGSVAENVVRHSLCPVLTVRPEGHQFVQPVGQEDSVSA